MGQRRETFGGRIYFLCNSRKMEKEKEENIWRREIFFADEKEKEKREGKVRKYLEKENIYLWRRRKKQRRKRRKIFGEEYIFCCGEEKRRRKRKKILGEQDHPRMKLALEQTIILGVQIF